MGLSYQEHNKQWNMYIGLPVNIFAGSDLAECLDTDLLQKRVKHYQYVDKKFMDDLRHEVNEYIHDEEKKLTIDILNILLFFTRNHKNEQLITNKERIVLIKQGMEDKDLKIREMACQMIQYMEDNDEMVTLIKQGMEDKDYEIREMACQMIQYVEDNDEMVALIKKGMEDKDHYVREKVYNMIQYVEDKNERVVLIKLGMKDQNIEVRARVCEMIQYVEDENKKVTLIKLGMKDKDKEYWIVRHNACQMIQYVEDKKKMVALIKKGMQDLHSWVRVIACEMIQFVEDKKKMIALIKKGIEDSYPKVVEKACEMMQYVEDNDGRVVFIKKIMKEKEKKGRVSAKICEMIQYVKDNDEMVALIKLGMEDQKFAVRLIVCKMIQYVKDKDEMFTLIKLGIEDKESMLVRIKACEMIQYVEDGDKMVALIKLGMEDNEFSQVREKACEMIQYLEDNNAKSVLIKQGIEDQNSDVRAKAYEMMQQKKVIIDSDMLFDKESHGLYTYLGGGSSIQSNTGGIIITDSYVGKAYQRILSVSPFLCRKNALEGTEIWKKLGFCYVPIEPILSFRYKEQKVTVVSKLLHMSIRELSNKYSSIYQHYKEYIKGEKKKIVTGLEMLGIGHNDIADRNFCVQFQYLHDGEIDTSIPPRIYLIDWDRAEFIS